jgi:hypothetical protein
MSFWECPSPELAVKTIQEWIDSTKLPPHPCDNTSYDHSNNHECCRVFTFDSAKHGYYQISKRVVLLVLRFMMFYTSVILNNKQKNMWKFISLQHEYIKKFMNSKGFNSSESPKNWGGKDHEVSCHFFNNFPSFDDRLLQEYIGTPYVNLFHIFKKINFLLSIVSDYMNGNSKNKNIVGYHVLDVESFLLSIYQIPFEFFHQITSDDNENIESDDDKDIELDTNENIESDDDKDIELGNNENIESDDDKDIEFGDTETNQPNNRFSRIDVLMGIIK